MFRYPSLKTTNPRLWGALRLIVLLVVFSVVLGVSFSLDARAQSSTTLRLINQISEIGGGTISGGRPESDTLSSGARVAVLSRAASRAYALANLNMGHADLEEAIRDGSAEVFRLAEGGRTPQAFEQTQASDKVYYVLALTGDGRLLESYVKDGGRGEGYYPGFTRLVSGEMVMGPVPAEHREPLRAVLKSAISSVVADTADGSQAEEDATGTSSSEEQKRSGSEDEASGDDSKGEGGYLQVIWAALSSWYGALVLGLLIGGGGVYRKYSKKLSKKKKRVSKLYRKMYVKKSDKKSEKEGKLHKEVLENKKQRIKNLTEEVKRKETKIGRLERKLNQSEGISSGRTSDQNSKSSGLQAFKPNSYDKGAPWGEEVDSEVATVGKVFADWCRTTGDQSGRELEDFADQLEGEISGAEVHRIYREKYAEELVFTESAREPVEYWLVRLGQRSLLLPKPQQSGFQEVKECFKGGNASSDESESVLSAIAPRDVKHILPATLAEEGGRGRALAEKGYISSGHTWENESLSRKKENEGGTTGSVPKAKLTARTIGEVFVKWCHSEDTMIGRYYMFERTLHDTLSGAEVSPIYRRSDAEGSYSFDADNTSDEFWLVEVEGESWLLPAPQKRDRFLALGEAFDEDNASPSTLSDLRPARMAPDGAGYELTHPGRLKADVES